MYWNIKSYCPHHVRTCFIPLHTFSSTFYYETYGRAFKLKIKINNKIYINMRVEEEHDTMCSVWTLSSLIIISINNIAVLLKTGINLRCFFSFFFHKTYILLPDQRDRQYIMLVHDVINWESYVWCAYMYEWEIIAQIISEPRAICTNAPMCLLLHIFFCLVSQLKNNNICLNDFCFVYLPLHTEEERVLLCFLFFSKARTLTFI